MLYLLCVTYTLSLVALLKTSDSIHSFKRFWIKVVTCIHPLLILLTGFLNQTIDSFATGLLWALIFALLGDVSLGLKHRFQAAMPLGIFFFSLAHIALSVLFYERTLFVWTLLLVFGSWIVLIKILLRNLMFGSYIPWIALYAFLILLMFGLASSSLILHCDFNHFVRWLGAFSFLLSDLFLSQKYFTKTQKDWIHISYLALYHLALSLMTLSAFI